MIKARPIAGRLFAGQSNFGKVTAVDFSPESDSY